MEELKILVEMVAGLPTMAIWVLIGFFIYKVCVVGSIFGVLRLLILKAHDWLKTPKDKLTKVNIYKDLGGIVIKEHYPELLQQIRRIRNTNGSSYISEYIHGSDVVWLEQAITDRKEREVKDKSKNK